MSSEISNKNSIVELVIEAKPKDIGDNFIVRRSLPHMKKRMVGPFIFWDHMGPFKLTEGKELKVRAHPHIGLATITYLFSGEIMHRDSLGNEQPIRPGEVNWMTAGKGISHSERSKYKGIDETLEGIQLWVALPKEYEDIEPSFHHFKEKSLPLIDLNQNKLRLVAGTALNKSSEVPVYSDLFYFKVDSLKNSNFDFILKANQEAAIYVIKGQIEIESKTYAPYTMIVFKKGTEVKFTSLTESELMFFGGEIYPEKRNIWWNFVSTDKDKIEQAKLNWKNNQFGEVINEDEFIPLPND